ncbi:lambda exonuclease family protein [Caldimonas tepidiphila]|uniref:lambda exonuclease family protein n=1 Tax=Caldimonas tepidiphila TaxID=2315841 RepID=UPI000E5AAFA5|nr:lambda exonuclease family protein [Caldimonas tepidiphila]
MKLIACAQGSEQWHAARAGCITASMFRVARERLKSGPNKGDFSAAAKDYAFKLAIERISGQPLDEGFETWQMKRGHELEPAARLEHELQTGLVVEPAGFVTTDDGLFGASADGLIGEGGGSEYKCLVSPEKLRSVLVSGDWSDYRDQVQGCMWITHRRWWEFCLYCPALEPIGRQLYRLRVERDEDYIADLETDLLAFARLVDQYEASLRQPLAA